MGYSPQFTKRDGARTPFNIEFCLCIAVIWQVTVFIPKSYLPSLKA